MTPPALPDIFAPRPRVPQPEYVNRVHRIGHPCVLYGWMCRVHWAYKRPAGDVLSRIFAEGHHWHRRVAGGMAARGVDFIRQEEPMLWPDLQLSGHMDGVVKPGPAVSGLAPGESAVVDTKGMSDFAFSSINTLEDLLSSKHWYHQSYVTQPTLYAVHPQVNAARCCLYCVKRSTAEVKQIWWRPEDVVEQIIGAKHACTRINEAIADDARDDRGEPLAPTQLATQGGWCADCDFQVVCPEYVIQSKGIAIAPEYVTELVTELQQLAEARSKYNKIKKALKGHWDTVGAGEYICGDFIVTVTEQPATEVPAKPATTKKAYFRTSYRPMPGTEKRSKP